MIELTVEMVPRDVISNNGKGSFGQCPNHKSTNTQIQFMTKWQKHVYVIFLNSWRFKNVKNVIPKSSIHKYSKTVDEQTTPHICHYFEIGTISKSKLVTQLILNYLLTKAGTGKIVVVLTVVLMKWSIRYP